MIKIARFEKTGLLWLFFLLMYCVFLISSVLFSIQLIVSTAFYFSDGQFLFSWQEASSAALRKGIAGGTVLGIGIWIKAKLEENKRKKNQP